MGGVIASEAYPDVVQPAIGCHWHTPPLQISAVQVLESLQSAAVVHGEPQMGVVVDVVEGMLQVVVVVVEGVVGVSGCGSERTGSKGITPATPRSSLRSNIIDWMTSGSVVPQ